MHPFARALAIVVACLAFQACASMPWSDPAPGRVAEELIAADVESVWRVLPRVLTRMGMRASLEGEGTERVLVVTRRVEVVRSAAGPRDAPWARCAVASDASVSDDGVTAAFRRASGFATLELRTAVTPTESGTRMQAELTVSASTPTSPKLDGGALCVTTGRLETLLFEAVRGLLAPPDSIAAPASSESGPFH